MRQDARGLAGTLERADDVQQVGVVALLGRRHAERPEPVERVVRRVEAGAPPLVRERRVGDDVVELFERIAVLELRVGERVPLVDERLRVVVEDHVHAGQAARRRVLLLSVEGQLGAGLVGHFQEQRAGPASRVIDGRVRAGPGGADAEDLGNDAADFGGRVELAFTLAALGGEVPHQVFVGVAKDVVAVATVPGEVESFVLEDGDQVGEPVDHLLAAAELRRVVEVRHVGQLVGVRQRADDLRVDLIADVRLAFECDQISETSPVRNRDRGERPAGVLVGDVLDEQQNEDVVLVLAGVHAAAEGVATRPERGVEFGLLQGHSGGSFRGMLRWCWGRQAEN